MNIFLQSPNFLETVAAEIEKNNTAACQLTAGLSALDAELPGSGWMGGELGVADITGACAFGFTQSVLGDLVETSRYPNLGAFCARAEALPAFRAAPPEDGATASAIGD